MSATDLPDGYRWATEAETEEYGSDPLTHPEMLVVVRTADATGKPYRQGEGPPPGPATRLVPDFVLQLTGEYQGNAYPEQREYEVRLAHDPEDGVQMLVTDSGGAPVAQPLLITEELADGILSMAQTNHDLNGYEDDWTLPTGMGRALYWVLQTDMDCEVRLDENDLGLIADWLQYATGEKTWNWAEQGDEWVAF